MFSPNLKNDPLLSAIKDVMAENDKHREAVDRANKHFKVTDKKQLPHNLHAYYEKMITESAVISEKITKSTPMGKVIADFEKSDAPQFEGKSKEKRREMAIAAKMAMDESLKGNQQKIDANKNNRIDAQDFEMLRKMSEDVMIEAINNILEQDTFTQAEYNTLMESPFGIAFLDARRNGEPEFEFGGKMYHSRQKGESEDEWKALLAKNSAPPVPKPRRADRMPSMAYSKIDLGVQKDNSDNPPFGVNQPPQNTGFSNPSKDVIDFNGISFKAGKGQSVSEPTDVNQVMPGATPSPGFTDPNRKPWETSFATGFK